jgi:hypothetical protein
MSERNYPEGYADRIHFFREGVRTGSDAYRKGMIAHFAQSAAIGAIDPTKEEDFRAYKGIVPYTPNRWTDWSREDYQDLLKYTGIRPKMNWYGSYLRWNPSLLNWDVKKTQDYQLSGVHQLAYSLTPPGDSGLPALQVELRGPTNKEPFYRVRRGDYRRDGKAQLLQNKDKELQQHWAAGTPEKVLTRLLVWFENTQMTPMQRLTAGLSNSAKTNPTPTFGWYPTGGTATIEYYRCYYNDLTIVAGIEGRWKGVSHYIDSIVVVPTGEPKATHKTARWAERFENSDDALYAVEQWFFDNCASPMDLLGRGLTGMDEAKTNPRNTNMKYANANPRPKTRTLRRKTYFTILIQLDGHDFEREDMILDVLTGRDRALFDGTDYDFQTEVRQLFFYPKTEVTADRLAKTLRALLKKLKIKGKVVKKKYRATNF